MGVRGAWTAASVLAFLSASKTESDVPKCAESRRDLRGVIGRMSFRGVEASTAIRNFSLSFPDLRGVNASERFGV